MKRPFRGGRSSDVLPVEQSGRPFPQFERLPRLVLVDDLQTALAVVIPFAAAAMARGLWLY